MGYNRKTWGAGLDLSADRNTYIRDNFDQLWFELHYQEFTGAIGSGSAWTGSAVTFSGAPIRIEFWVPFQSGPNFASDVVTTWLQRDSADHLLFVDAWNNPIANADASGATFFRRIAAPASGSHTYGLRNAGGTGRTLYASASAPAALTIWQRGL